MDESPVVHCHTLANNLGAVRAAGNSLAEAQVPGAFLFMKELSTRKLLKINGGHSRIRTYDFHRVKVALYR